MQTLWAKHALVANEWQSGVAVTIGENGKIHSVEANSDPTEQTAVQTVDLLLPSPANLHSHAFQRAMAGLTESRGPDPKDSFWTWRRLMYRFLEQLTPHDVETITRFVQMEMLEAGYSTCVEFHYLHHQLDGTPYDDIGEMASRICAAAEKTEIGLTLLPVLYEQGGCDGRKLGAGQVRFGNDIDRYEKLLNACSNTLSALPEDSQLGVAAHSLRAVSKPSLVAAASMQPNSPFHMHISEQSAEVEEVQREYGARPMRWLLDNHGVDARWCLIHCTHMEPGETVALAKSGAVAGLCPITESSLGDGIFDGLRYVEEGGTLGIGSDSNIRISLSEELRTLEYSQRLKVQGRAVLANAHHSTGRVLFDHAVRGGAQAAGRNSGSIEVGKFADLLSLDCDNVDMAGKYGDTLLDTYIFAGDDRLVRDVWSAGRHVVKDGTHIQHDRITRQYRSTLSKLQNAI